MAAYCPPNKRVEPTNSQDSKFSDNLKFVNMNHLLLTSTSVESILKLVNAYPPGDFNRILNKYTRFFDFRFELKNSLSDDTISLDDLLDISTTN